METMIKRTGFETLCSMMQSTNKREQIKAIKILYGFNKANQSRFAKWLEKKAISQEEAG